MFVGREEQPARERVQRFSDGFFLLPALQIARFAAALALRAGAAQALHIVAEGKQKYSITS